MAGMIGIARLGGLAAAMLCVIGDLNEDAFATTQGWQLPQARAESAATTANRIDGQY